MIYSTYVYIYKYIIAFIYVGTYNPNLKVKNGSHLPINLAWSFPPRMMDWVARTARIRWWFCLSLQQSWQALLVVCSLSQRPCHRRAKRCEMGQSKSCQNHWSKWCQIQSLSSLISPVHLPTLCSRACFVLYFCAILMDLLMPRAWLRAVPAATWENWAQAGPVKSRSLIYQEEKGHCSYCT